MKKNKTHYYSEHGDEDSWITACGRDGHKTGGFVAFFFKIVKKSERCKVCDKVFEKKQHNEKKISKAK